MKDLCARYKSGSASLIVMSPWNDISGFGIKPFPENPSARAQFAYNFSVLKHWLAHKHARASARRYLQT
jgi:hypothetical protein